MLPAELVAESKPTSSGGEEAVMEEDVPQTTHNVILGPLFSLKLLKTKCKIFDLQKGR